MFENFKPVKADPILGLSKLCNEDPREGALDLGVGVFKDKTGHTPIMRAVKSAEAKLHIEQTTKVYTSLAGSELFRNKMLDLILGASVGRERIATLQTPGGTGAVRQIFESIKIISPDSTVWISDPSWPSHSSMATHMGFKIKLYPYLDGRTQMVDIDAMLESFKELKAGDVLLLHGCCHNPTGANIDLETWKILVDVVNDTGAVPLVDLAYQGFGDGLDEDAEPLRFLASQVPEMYVAASCSKNFGLYRDRVGVAILISENEKTAALSQDNMNILNRLNYSFAPDHGAAIVAMILDCPDLRVQWSKELSEMRNAMLSIRNNLSNSLRQQCNSDRFEFISIHRGMFSRLGLSNEEVVALRERYGIYIVGDSRINIAGLAGDKHKKFSEAVAQVIAKP